MSNSWAEKAALSREDFSRFVVHLTRDTSHTTSGGGNARNNLISILNSKMLRRGQAHCLFNAKLDELPEQVSATFPVVCLTEVPLHQIHLLTRPISGRSVNLEPYGIVLNREFVIAHGGQPAIYINSYNGNMSTRESVDAIFVQAMKNAGAGDPIWRLFPFINAMHETYDFTWEREWRLIQDLPFTLADLVCLILPEKGEDNFKEASYKTGVPFISPGWGYERIVGELSRQQRAAKNFHSVKHG